MKLSCQNTLTEKNNKYSWKPTECAPKDYPVQIYSGSLYYGDKGNSIYIPDSRTVDYGWGETGSIHAAGEELKEAPDTLDLTWYSFTENKNFTGKFPLNNVLIDSLLNAGIPAEDTPAGHLKYLYLKVGMAPGGVIVIWLDGPGRQVDVGRYQAKETNDVDWKKAMPDYDGTMIEYSKLVTSHLKDSIKKIIAENKIPYGYWDHWRRHFSWKPVIKGDVNASSINMFMFNKESEELIGNRLTHAVYEKRAAPEKVNIFWKDSKQREWRSQVDFNETENDQIFSALNPGEPVDLIFDVQNNGDVTTSLKTKNEVIPFKKVVFNSYLH